MVDRAAYGYDDGESLGWYRAAVERALRGARGQRFLRELLRVLDRLPRKELIAGALKSDAGVCAIGAVLEARGCATDFDVTDYDAIAREIGIAPSLVREVEWTNDEYSLEAGYRYAVTPRERFKLVRNWVLWEIGSLDPVDYYRATFRIRSRLAKRVRFPH